MLGSGFSLIGIGYLLAALRALTATDKDDGVEMLAELLSVKACPAGVLLLLHLAAAGSLAASGLSFGLAAHSGPYARPPPAALAGGLAAHAAFSLGAGLHEKIALGGGGGKRGKAAPSSLPLLAAAQAPRALNLAGLTFAVKPLLTKRGGGGGGGGGSKAAVGPPLKEPTYFLLDIDGTLVVSDDLYFVAFKQLLEPRGFVVDEPFYAKNVLGGADKQVFENLFPDATPDEITALGVEKDRLFCKLYRELCAKEGPPMIPGLAEALTAAKALGIKAIAATNAPRGAAEACIESLRQTIPAASIIHPTIIVGAECSAPKPSPEPYLKAAGIIGAPLDRCIVFEDSPSGVKAGVNAKARAAVERA